MCRSIRGPNPPDSLSWGTKEWDNQKTAAKASVKQLAHDLLMTYTERRSIKGHAFSPDTVWQQEFEEAFEYDETPGQLSATEEIKADMESDSIMDRLLLGDVGYGKTEVAARACFKAVMERQTVRRANAHHAARTSAFRDLFQAFRTVWIKCGLSVTFCYGQADKGESCKNIVRRGKYYHRNTQNAFIGYSVCRPWIACYR